MMTLHQPGRRDKEDSSGAERRRGLRISQQRPVKVYEPWSTRYIGGQTHDVSATGLRIEPPVSAPGREGKVRSIHVGLSDHGESLANRRQMIPARVVWIERRSNAEGNPSRLTAGVEFLTS